MTDCIAMNMEWFNITLDAICFFSFEFIYILKYYHTKTQYNLIALVKLSHNIYASQTVGAMP